MFTTTVPSHCPSCGSTNIVCLMEEEDGKIHFHNVAGKRSPLTRVPFDDVICYDCRDRVGIVTSRGA